jgi:hypothetical protein
MTLKQGFIESATIAKSFNEGVKDIAVADYHFWDGLHVA